MELPEMLDRIDFAVGSISPENLARKLESYGMDFDNPPPRIMKLPSKAKIEAQIRDRVDRQLKTLYSELYDPHEEWRAEFRDKMLPISKWCDENRKDRCICSFHPDYSSIQEEFRGRNEELIKTGAILAVKTREIRSEAAEFFWKRFRGISNYLENSF